MSNGTTTGSVHLQTAASASVVATGSAEPQDWTVETTYDAKNINPDLQVTLWIGDQSFTIAPGFTTSTHKGNGREVRYECTFLAGVDLLVSWTIS